MLTYSRDSGTQMMIAFDRTGRLFDIANLDGMQGTYTITMMAVYQSVVYDASTAAMVDFSGEGSLCVM